MIKSLVLKEKDNDIVKLQNYETIIKTHNYQGILVGVILYFGIILRGSIQMLPSKSQFPACRSG